MTKFLIFSSSATNGHVRATQALEATSRQMPAFCLSIGPLQRAIHAAEADATVRTHLLPAELPMRERAERRIACPVRLQVSDHGSHTLCPAA